MPVSPRRWSRLMASAALAVLVAVVPARAAGPPATSPGKGHTSSPPSRSTLPQPHATGTTPFAWIDDANLLAPGSAALTVSALGWQGADASEVGLPVVGVAVGVTQRFQLGASVPYIVGNDTAGVVGGWGTTYLSGKIGILQHDTAGVKLAVAPTLEVLGAGVLQSLAPGESRVRWGLPVSAEIDRGGARLFASAGYFSGGIGFVGGGLGVQTSPRVTLSGSFSHAWSSETPATATTGATPVRTELSGGGSIVVTSRVGVFGSIGHTIATTDANGAGVTVIGGVSFLTGPIGFRP